MTPEFVPVAAEVAPGEASANRDRIADLFPDAITEGGIDFDVLRELLGEEVIDSEAEKFGLSWPGRAAARRQALLPPTGTLLPMPEESVNWDTTGNTVIEGDNLEVLRLLRRAYVGKVKMIYIDPPYNTGNEFIYNDSFADGVRSYEEFTRQRDETGKLAANTDTSGRKHSNWLSMMYPRLRVARDLLREDGVILVSIDGNEMPLLTQLLSAVFGTENYIATFVWVSNLKGRQISDAGPAGTHEYLICIGRNRDLVSQFRASGTMLRSLMPSVYRGAEYAVRHDAKGPYVLKNELYNTNSKFNEHTAPTMVFDVHYNPETRDVRVTDVGADFSEPGYLTTHPHRNARADVLWHAWRWSRARVLTDHADLEFVTDSGRLRIFTKVRDIEGMTLKDIIIGPSTTSGAADLAVLGMERTFDTAKPLSLIKLLVSVITDGNDIVLDFFAGSGTTGHAVMAQNAADGGDRHFILVQLDEPVNEDGFSSIADITRERLRRAGKKVLADAPAVADRLDVGFRSYRLASSNIRAWDGTPEAFTLDDSVDNIVAGRTESDLLVEMMLRLGVELTTPVETREVRGHTLYDLGHGTVYACLGDGVTTSDAIALADSILAWRDEEVTVTDTTVVVRDSGFADDAAKLNLAEALSQAGITSLRSL